MAPEEFLRLFVGAIREKSDAEEVFLPGKVDAIFEEAIAEAMMAMILMDDDVLEEKDESSLCGGDGEEEVVHGDDAAIFAEDEDASAAGLLEDEAQATHVLGAVWTEVAFEGKEIEEEFREFRKIIQRGRFDRNVLHVKGGICHRLGRRGIDDFRF